MMNEDVMNRRAQEVQSALEAKHGKEVTQGMIDAIAKQGLNQDFLWQVVSSGPDNFQRLAEESLLNVMQRAGPNDPEVRRAEENYGQIREQQRQLWRQGHGRR
jgi:hypothetical protein